MFIIFIALPCIQAGDVDVNSTNNFTELNQIINESDAYVDLTADYKGINEDLVISKSVEIDGNGHIVDCKRSPVIINASNILFKNITFKNLRIDFKGNFSNLTFIDCNIMKNFKSPSVKADPYFKLDKTGNISKKVKRLAKHIAGDSKGIAACQKLAKWVSDNIKHETKAGFYQSPDKTLKRKRGNCCSKTDLFLQMCDAVGITKNHKLYYVQVGEKFHHRHFFAKVDNAFVDVDSKYNDPWGHVCVGNMKLNKITPYPYLPISRDY